LVNKFEGGLSVEVRRQEKIDMTGEREFRRGILLGKYMAKLLYRWDDGKFKVEYLRKLERNWQRWKSVSLEEKSQRGGNVRVVRSGLSSFLIFFLFSSYFLLSFSSYFPFLYF